MDQLHLFGFAVTDKTNGLRKFEQEQRYFNPTSNATYIGSTGSKVPFWHFSDSTHQECMIFARIGHGSCYYHWNEIFAGVPMQLILVQWVQRIPTISDLQVP